MALVSMLMRGLFRISLCLAPFSLPDASPNWKLHQVAALLRTCYGASGSEFTLVKIVQSDQGNKKIYTLNGR